LTTNRFLSHLATKLNPFKLPLLALDREDDSYPLTLLQSTDLEEARTLSKTIDDANIILFEQ